MAQGQCSREVSPELELFENVRLQVQTLFQPGTPDHLALECFFHLPCSVSTLVSPSFDNNKKNILACSDFSYFTSLETETIPDSVQYGHA